MALSHAKAKAAATFARDLANEAKRLSWRIETFLKHNSTLSIDWGNATKPAFLNEDASGNIDGLAFSRADLSNAIGSLDNIRKCLRNEAVLQGDHLGNLEKLADADPSSN